MADDDSIVLEAELLPDAPERGSATELMDHGAADDPLGPMRHSAAHVLAEAVLDLFPGTKLGIGPVIDDGFYYDFQLPRPLTPDDLPAIEARMRDSIAADHPFELSELSPADARAFLEGGRGHRGPVALRRGPQRVTSETPSSSLLTCRVATPLRWDRGSEPLVLALDEGFCDS